MKVYQRKGSPFWQFAVTGPDGETRRRSTGVHVSRPQAEAARAAARLPAATPAERVQRSLLDALESYAEAFTGHYARMVRSQGSKAATILGNPRLVDFDQKTVETLRAALRRGGNAESTIGRTLAVCRAAIAQAKREGFATWGGDVEWRISDAPARERFLSQGEVARLMDHTPGNVARATIGLLVLTGLRWNEVAVLRWRDVGFADNVITVRGKGDKVRHVPLLPAAREAAVVLLRVPVDQLSADRRDQFCVPDVAVVHREIERAIEAAGLNVGRARLDRCTIHTLRHTFASLARQRGLPLDHLQKLLGHGSLKTTMRYAKVDDGQTAGLLGAALAGVTHSLPHDGGAPEEEETR